ncbi:hypothetical protein DL96DRAFT_472811 [Flagelloscypha sp. PMI_526]|nr:hypothetical protein DL96DRAFT_472811 [Flagelloscypha sp. PMI_526]
MVYRFTMNPAVDSPNSVDHISDSSSQFGDSLGDFLSIYPSLPSMSPQDNSSFIQGGVGEYPRENPWPSFPGHGRSHIYSAASTGLPPQLQPLPQSSYSQPGGSSQAISPDLSPSTTPRGTPSILLDPSHPSGRVPRRRNPPMANPSPSPIYDQLEDFDDFETVPPLPANPTAEEKAQWLRKKNTLSARKNRKLKAIRAQRLEDQVAQLTIEKEIWKTRAETLRQLLSSHGIPCPNWDD